MKLSNYELQILTIFKLYEDQQILTPKKISNYSKIDISHTYKTLKMLEQKKLIQKINIRPLKYILIQND